MGLFGGKSEEDLRTSGTQTTARVVYVDDTGKRRGDGIEAKVKLQLKIDSGSARGRDLDKTKWVPVSRIPRVGEIVGIRFDPDDVDDWAWSDATMYEPALVAADRSVAPSQHIPPPPGMGVPAGPPPPGPAPATMQGNEEMVEFIQNAAGPWGNVPGFKQMIESAMETNQVYVQNLDLRSDRAGMGGRARHAPARRSSARARGRRVHPGHGRSPAPGRRAARAGTRHRRRAPRPAQEDHRLDLSYEKRTVHPLSRRSPGRARLSWTPIRLPRGA